MDRARDALAQAQKLEAIGRLTGGVAHDFNNLLTIIRSSAEMLRKTGHDEVRRERYIQAIADAADRAALLSRQLLAFARQQPLRPEIFRADARIKAMTQMIRTILRRDAQPGDAVRRSPRAGRGRRQPIRHGHPQHGHQCE